MKLESCARDKLVYIKRTSRLVVSAIMVPQY